MTPFKENITKSIDNLNKLQEDVENTITDLQEQVVVLEEQVEEMENLQTKNVTITENGTTEITPDSGYYALDKVNLTVNAGSSYIISDCAYLFYEKHRLEQIEDITNIKPTNANYMFGFCRDLPPEVIQKINNLIDTIDFSDCTIFTNMFRTCSVTDVAIDTSNATTITEMFRYSGITNLSVLNLSSLNDTGLINAFANCVGLTNVSLQNILKSLLTLPQTFAGTKTLKITGLTTAQATICTGFDEWTTLVANGWTTGYET